MRFLCFLTLCSGFVFGSVGAVAQTPSTTARTLTEAVAPNAILYTARTVQTREDDIEVVTTLFRADPDGQSASELASSDCEPGCMVRAIRVTPDGNRLVPGDEGGPGGWAVVITTDGARIEIDGVLVGRGEARLGMPEGEYTLTLRNYGSADIEQPLQISHAQEMTKPQLFRRAAPVFITANDATPPSEPLTTPLTLLDDPMSGWRMVAVLDAEEAEAARQAEEVAAADAAAQQEAEQAAALAAAEAAARQAREDSLALAAAPPPAPDPASSTADPEPPLATEGMDELATDTSTVATPQTPEVAETTTNSPDEAAPATDRSAATETAPLCPSAEDPMAEVQRLIRAAAYTDARDCLRTLAARSGNSATIRRQIAVLDNTIAIEDALAPQERDFAAFRRQNLASAYDRGDRTRLLDYAREALSASPGDLATVAILTDAFRLTAEPDTAVVLDFIYIPGPEIRPQQASVLESNEGVDADGFMLGTTEITNAQFARFLTVTNASQPDRGDRALIVRRPEGLRKTRQGWEPAPDVADLPVVDATFYGAKAFAEWAGGRLPHRNEWRWAYRSATAEGSITDANLATEGGRGALAPPGSYDADALGLFDMIGNVWEWTEPPSGTGAVAAGGSYTSRAGQLASALTRAANPLSPDGHIGFRVLRTLDSYPEPE